MSNPPACADCGDPVDNKDNAGHWRERCEECQQAIADAVEPAGEIVVDLGGDEE